MADSDQPDTQSDPGTRTWIESTGKLSKDLTDYIANANFRAVIGAIGAYGWETVQRSWRGFRHTLGLDDLSKRQKGNIAFQIGNILAIPTFTILLLALMVGASIIVPPFLMISSFGAAVREFSIFYNERMQFKDLKEKLTSEEDLKTLLLNMGFNPHEDTPLNCYIFKQKEIYEKLYAHRESLIDNENFDDIKKINNLIEKLSKGEDILEADYAQLNLDDYTKRLIQQYEEGKKLYNEFEGSESLKTKIDYFMVNRHTICAQDFSADIKSSLIKISEGVKCKKEPLKELVSKMLEHFQELKNAESPVSSPQIPLVDPKLKALHDPNRKIGTLEKIAAWGSKSFASSKSKTTTDEPLSEAEKEFTNRFEGVFLIIERNESMNYLIRSIPRRFANGVMGTCIFLITLVSTALLPFLLSPAAPAFAPISIALTAICGVLTLATLLNGFGLEISKFKSGRKVSKEKSKLKKIITDVIRKKQEKVPQEEIIAHNWKQPEKKHKNEEKRRSSLTISFHRNKEKDKEKKEEDKEKGKEKHQNKGPE